MSATPPTEPRLRKDAAENRERLLVAGRELFARHGLGVTLNDVAHHAGVGVGTAYRRFANKEQLIDAILERQDEEMERILHAALAEPDPWAGLVAYLERSLELQTKDRGMAQIFSGRHGRAVRYDEARDRLAPLVNRVAERARDAGTLRADATGTDLILLQIALNAVAEVSTDGPRPEGRDDVEQIYRRYLRIALDGLRADGPVTDLPVPALTTLQTHQLLRPIRPGQDASGTAPEPADDDPEAAR
ncbi:MAG: TetR/AcrR family transcriptional regulator [Actinomycetaceae bacterium]